MPGPKTNGEPGGPGNDAVARGAAPVTTEGQSTIDNRQASIPPLLAPPSPRRLRALLLLLFLLAVALRLGAVLARGPGRIGFPDSRQYLEMADNFGRGRGFVFEHEEAGRVPGYAFLLWLVGALGADPVVGIKVVQALLGGVAALLAWWIGRRELGVRAGWIAGALVAGDPFLIFVSTEVLVEATLTTLLLAQMALLLRAVDGPSLRWAAGAGAVNGLACLVHPNQLAYVGFLLPFWLLRAGRARAGRTLAAWGLFALAALVVILPWSVRNYARLGAVVPLTSRLGDGLYEAFCPEADGGPVKDVIRWPAGIAGLGEVERDRFLRGEAWRLIAADPGRVGALAARKFVRFWNVVPNHAPYRTPLYSAVSLTLYAGVLVLALVGLARAGRDLRARALLASPALYNMSLHLIFVSSLRFRVPIMPFVAFFAAAAAAAACRARTSLPGRPLT